jgi:hypothetical protein
MQNENSGVSGFDNLLSWNKIIIIIIIIIIEFKV